MLQIHQNEHKNQTKLCISVTLANLRPLTCADIPKCQINYYLHSPVCGIRAVATGVEGAVLAGALFVKAKIKFDVTKAINKQKW